MRIFWVPSLPSRQNYLLLLLLLSDVDVVFLFCCPLFLLMSEQRWIVTVSCMINALFQQSLHVYVLLVYAWLEWPISLLYRILECIAVTSHITALVVIASTLDFRFRSPHPFQWCQKGEDEYDLVSIGLLSLSWPLNSCFLSSVRVDNCFGTNIYLPCLTINCHWWLMVTWFVIIKKGEIVDPINV